MARAHGMDENRDGRWAAANHDVPFKELHRFMHCFTYRPLVLVVARVSRHLGECLFTCMSLRMGVLHAGVLESMCTPTCVPCV